MHTNAKRLNVVHVSVLTALASLAGACVTSPYNGELVGGVATPITVAGFHHQPNAPLIIEAANTITGVWEPVGTATTGTTPALPAGTWQNSPALYHYNATVQVADPDDPFSIQRWGSGASRGLDTLVATLRVRSGDFLLYSGQEQSATCVAETGSQSEDFYTTAFECGYQQSTVWIQAIPVSTGNYCADLRQKILDVWELGDFELFMSLVDLHVRYC